MKFVKLIRPLFLVALGLHGLALFLPIGGTAETAEAEVAEETVPAERSSSPEKLPVPDLNVAADETVLVPGSGAFSSLLSPTAVSQTVPATQPRVATRSAPLAATVSNAAVTRATPMGNPSVSAGSAPSASPAAAADSSPPLSLPDVEATDGSSGSPSESSPSSPAAAKIPASENSAEGMAEPDRGLIASAVHQLPDSLKLLMNRWAIALAYNPKGTDDSSAKTAQSKWKDKINAQASGIGVLSLEPERMEDFDRLSYPIESSERDRKQSFRVCLDQPPGPAEVGVLFDSQGEIAGKPELIRSTGYKAINEEVVATVEAAEDFPEDRLSQAFIFEVGVDYDSKSCVRLSDLKN